MKNPRDEAPIQLYPFHHEVPHNDTETHKLGVRGQGGREGRLQMVRGHLKTKENIAGPGLRTYCKTEQRVQLLPEDCRPFGKTKMFR